MYAYEKLMQDENLKLSELPDDAQTGIRGIKDIEKAINLVRKKGAEPTEITMKKLKANDKWVVGEILDYIEEKNENPPAPPNDAIKVIEEMKAKAEAKKLADEEEENKKKKEEAENLDGEGKGSAKGDTEESTIDAVGLSIEGELKKLHENDKSEYQLDELRTLAPKTYDVIFENYDDSGDNGVKTSHYSLIETEEKQFTISKN